MALAYLLKEDGSNILLEDGSGSLLLESSTPGASSPVIISDADKEGVRIISILAVPSGSDSIAFDCRGAAKVVGVSDRDFTWKWKDLDGNTHELEASRDVIHAIGPPTTTVVSVGQVNNPPPVMVVERASGGSAGAVYIRIIFHRRRDEDGCY